MSVSALLSFRPPLPLQVVALSEMGYLKGGTEGCMIIAHGDRWADLAGGGGDAALGGRGALRAA